MSNNVENLFQYILAHSIGTIFSCATSQYADNTTASGHRFDTYSTSQAVRALEKRGFIAIEYRWRYYDCTILSHTEFSESVYTKAIDQLAEQLIAMAQEDVEDKEDQVELQCIAEDYAGDAVEQLVEKIVKIINGKK